MEKKSGRVKKGGVYAMARPKIMEVKEGAGIQHSVNAVLRTTVDLPTNGKHAESNVLVIIRLDHFPELHECPIGIIFFFSSFFSSLF